jgi:hypothetical protein
MKGKDVSHTPVSVLLSLLLALSSALLVLVLVYPLFFGRKDVCTGILLDRSEPTLVRSYVVSYWRGHHYEERTDAPQPGLRWSRLGSHRHCALFGLRAGGERVAVLQQLFYR